MYDTALTKLKGVYPYELMNNWAKYEETQLPPIHNFIPSLEINNFSRRLYSCT